MSTYHVHVLKASIWLLVHCTSGFQWVYCHILPLVCCGVCCCCRCYCCCCSPFNWADENPATDMVSMIQIDGRSKE